MPPLTEKTLVEQELFVLVVKHQLMVFVVEQCLHVMQMVILKLQWTNSEAYLDISWDETEQACEQNNSRLEDVSADPLVDRKPD